MKKPRISPTLLALPLLVSVVFAQDNPHVAYENTLLGRALPAADKKICDEKAGPRSEANGVTYDACHVTRQFVADLAAKKTQGRFPPSASIKYCVTAAEKALLVDSL